MNVILQEPRIVESIFVNHYAKHKSYHREEHKGGWNYLGNLIYHSGNLGVWNFNFLWQETGWRMECIQDQNFF